MSRLVRTLLASLFLAWAACSLQACSLLRPGNVFDQLPLLPPSDFGQRVQLSQRVALQRFPATHAGVERTDSAVTQDALVLIGAWSVTDVAINFVGLTPSGQTLLTLQYDGEAFTQEYSPALQQPISGREILAQVQLAYWPVDAIRRAFEGSDWRMDVEGGGRVVYLGQRKVLSIEHVSSALIDLAELDSKELHLKEYGSGKMTSVRIRNYRHGYQLLIDTLDQVALP